jgi:hypothetical protein
MGQIEIMSPKGRKGRKPTGEEDQPACYSKAKMTVSFKDKPTGEEECTAGQCIRGGFTIS